MPTPVEDSIPLSGDPLIDGVVQGGSWDFGVGPMVMTYAYHSASGTSWSGKAQDNIEMMLEAFSSVSNLTFQEIEVSGAADFTQSPADVAFIWGGFLPGVAGLAFFPDPPFADTILGSLGYTRAEWPNPEGDVVLFEDNGVRTDLKPGTFGYLVALHELGHALGLKHPHDDGGNGRPLMPAPFDDGYYTVMSYNDPQIVDYGIYLDFNKGFQTTLMPLDILAIQYMYGVNMTYRTGDDVYALKNDGIVKTIWDAGGNDTISASGLGSVGVVISLVEGSFITHGDGFSTTAIAYNVTIENAFGSGGSDTLIGNDVGNRLDGAAGADVMQGGLGDDVYFVDNLGDVVMENPGEGTDTIFSSVNFDLSVSAPDVEHLTLMGGAKIGTGNDADNTILGTKGSNTLSGGLGADYIFGDRGSDIMAGGDGDDIFFVDNRRDMVIEAFGEGTDEVFATTTFTLGANVENLTLIGPRSMNGIGNDLDNIITGGAGGNLLAGGLGDDTLAGGFGKDKLYGEDGMDTLAGEDGDDTLDGGAGDDVLTGGVGKDVYYVDSAGDVVNESAADPDFDIVFATVSFSLAPASSDGVEKLILIGGDIDGTGNALNNDIIGTNGNNVLDGGLGDDVLVGYNGDDTYIVDSLGDFIRDTGGNDTVVASIDYTLFHPRLENLTLSGVADLNGTGNAAANVLTGNDGANVLSGLGGNDTIDGGLGDDIIDGGVGNDLLTGGGGIDTFWFHDSISAKNVDTITDFTDGPGGDILDIADILTGYTGIVTDYVMVTQVGPDSIVSVDANGLAGGANFQQVFVLQGVNVGTDEALLVANGNLVVT